MEILGVTITGLIAFVFLLVGIIGLIGKGTLGSGVRGFLGAIPLGNPKIWSVLIIVVGLAAGGFAYGTATVSGFFSGTTASLTSDSQNAVTSQVTCEFGTVQEVTSTDNITVRADNNQLDLYYADVQYDQADNSINGTLLCTDNRADISKGVAHDCWIDSDTFRSETSTTDSNTYNILATSASASKVPGQAYQQTAYVVDSGSSNTAATTSSPTERTSLVFAQDEKAQYLGFYLTLPSQTALNAINNQTTNDVKVVCDGQTVGTLRTVKVSSI